MRLDYLGVEVCCRNTRADKRSIVPLDSAFIADRGSLLCSRAHTLHCDCTAGAKIEPTFGLISLVKTLINAWTSS